MRFGVSAVWAAVFSLPVSKIPVQNSSANRLTDLKRDPFMMNLLSQSLRWKRHLAASSLKKAARRRFYFQKAVREVIGIPSQSVKALKTDQGLLLRKGKAVLPERFLAVISGQIRNKPFRQSGLTGV